LAVRALLCALTWAREKVWESSPETPFVLDSDTTQDSNALNKMEVEIPPRIRPSMRIQ